MNSGNTQLVDYGIQNENSDFRVHVCPLAKCVYVYPTFCGVRAIKSGKYRKVPVYTNGVETAQGYIVPYSKIENCVAVELLDRTWEEANILESLSEQEKGARAEALIVKILQLGFLPLPQTAIVVTDAETQIAGGDILASSTEKKIQVKCDFKGGGQGDINRCTGNLFLQIAECNPNSTH